MSKIFPDTEKQPMTVDPVSRDEISTFQAANDQARAERNKRIANAGKRESSDRFNGTYLEYLDKKDEERRQENPASLRKKLLTGALAISLMIGGAMAYFDFLTKRDAQLRAMGQEQIDQKTLDEEKLSQDKEVADAQWAAEHPGETDSYYPVQQSDGSIEWQGEVIPPSE